jgi:hypothetical protein
VTHPLVDEAMKKAAVAWIAADGNPPVALWCLPLDGALYVVSGPGEQTAPGLAHAGEATVSLRGDHGGRVVTWTAVVTQVDPRSEEWATIAPQLAGKRLNATGTADEVAARWARDCTLNRLNPVGDPVEAAGTQDGPSEAARPRETPASRRTRNPFRLHRVRGSR